MGSIVLNSQTGEVNSTAIININNQLADSQGTIINPAKEDGNLQTISSEIVTKLNLTLSDLLNGIKGIDNKDISTLEQKIIDLQTFLNNKFNLSIQDLANALEQITVTIDNIIGIKDTSGTQINPATLESIQGLNTLLTDIKTLINSLDTKTIIVNTNDVKITSSVLPTNAAKEAGGNLDLIKSNTDKIDVSLSTRATETTLQNIDTNVIALSPKVDAIKTQLDTRVRGLFDVNGDPINSVLIPITGNRSISNLSATIDQYYAFNKQMFYYGYSVSIGGNDTNVMALINPVGSGKTILIKRICIARNQDNNNGVFFSIRSGATVSSGTPVTPLSTISGGTSAAVLYTAPAVTATGNLLCVMALNSNESSKQEDFNLIYGLNTGENLLIIGNATANGTPCFVTLNWVEV